MKRFIAFFSAILLTVASVSAQTPYAIFCQTDSALYFDYTTEPINKGDTYLGQTVTTVWSGDKALKGDSWFIYKDKVKSVRFLPDFINVKPTSTALWFYSFRNLRTIFGLEYLNTLYVTDMREMFSGCSSLTSLDLSGFITWSVTDMSDMFHGCSSLITLNLSHFNTSNLTELKNMFFGCSSLISLDLSSFSTSKVTDMSYMFYKCSSLTSINLTSFNTSNVENMNGMFYECNALTAIDLSSFSTSNVVDMGGMFYMCNSLTSLDVSHFNTSNVENMAHMFDGCTSLKTIFCEDQWTCQSSFYMFFGCTSLKGAVSYTSSNTGVSMANPDTGYFTRKIYYNLWLCGTQVSNANCTDLTQIEGVTLSGEGAYAYYDPHSKTLHLHKANISRRWTTPLRTAIDGLTIQCGALGLEPSLTGIQATDAECGQAMDVASNTTITGPDPLWVVGGTLIDPLVPGIYLRGGNLTVNDGNIVVAGTIGLYGLTARWDPFYDLTVTGQSSVTIAGIDYSLGKLRNLVLGENVSITAPEGAVFEDSYVRVNGEVVKDVAVNIQYTQTNLSGDVNEDGSVDINDVVAVINVMAGTATWPNANVNGDTKVDINDVVAIINIMAGK